MLHRKEANGLVLISQPAHSWVSGQLARLWGNERFGEFMPTDDVCLAAALHDIGFINWEQSPTLNPETGLPHCFRDMPADCHFELWSKSVAEMMRYGRYPSVLVSLHFAGLCQRHRILGSPKEQAIKTAFLDRQETHQSTLLTSLQNDYYYQKFTTPEVLERNRQLLSVWDWMSLAICLGVEGDAVFDDVPTAADSIKLTLTRKDSVRISVNPWPFKSGSNSEPIQIMCEGQRLLGTYTDEVEMRKSIRAGSPATTRIELVP